MRTMRKLGIHLLLAGLAVAAVQAGAGTLPDAEVAVAASEQARAAPAARAGDAGTPGGAKATILDLMEQVCRNRRESQQNVCVEHCKSQGMWGWYDDPGSTCGYGARCTCVYYA